MQNIRFFKDVSALDQSDVGPLFMGTLDSTHLQALEDEYKTRNIQVLLYREVKVQSNILNEHWSVRIENVTDRNAKTMLTNK